jgi:hypothetical protein
MNKKTFASILAVLSIVGYGAFVFAVGPFAPGTVLDPGCSPYINNDPNQGVDLDCTVIIGGGSVTATNGLSILGSDVGLGGQLTQSTVINQDGNDFLISGSFNFGSSDTDWNNLGTILGDPIPGIGFYSTTPQNDNLYSQIAIIEADGSESVFIGKFDIPNELLRGLFVGDFEVGLANVNVANDTQSRLFVNRDDIVTRFSDRTTGEQVETIVDLNGITFYYADGIGGTSQYTFPRVDGTNGQVLTTNGSGTLSWTTVSGGGGSSPFSVVNDFSIFSTGLADVGTNSNAIFSFFLGEGAGYEATEADFSNFIGDYSGYQAVNAEFSNFIGSNAGFGATDAYYSNFIGTNTGVNATNARYSNFIGHAAGNGATFAEFSNFIGDNAGNGAVDANNSNFFGLQAGSGAIEASNSNFFGDSAGFNATSADSSNFLGNRAGQNATNASNSNFLGLNSGESAINASNSIFLGTRSGNNDAVNNILIVNYSSPSASFQVGETISSSSGGEGVIVSDNGSSLEIAVVGTFDFIPSDTISGNQSGTTATIDSTSGGGTSILIGHNTNTGGFSDSIAMGAFATNTATNQFMIGSANRPINDLIISGTGSLFLPIGDDSQRTSYASDGAIRYNTDQVCVEVYSGGNWACLGGGGGSSPFSVQNSTSMFSTGMTNTGLNSTATESFFVGDYAGENATDVFRSNFLGRYAGAEAINATYANFFGFYAGFGATDAHNSNFLGNGAGYEATSVNGSNFIGPNAGQQATNASFSNFLGSAAGFDATNANDSNFFGTQAGIRATNANDSNFLGSRAGLNATNASHSFFVGENAGRYDPNSPPIGTQNAANSIFIGRDAAYTLADNGLNNTTNADDYSILLGNYTSTGGFENSIAMGQRATNTASNQFMIGSTTRRIEEMVFNGGVGNTCSIVAGTGISCSSDQRLKTNITDLGSDTLANLLNIQTVTYNWKEGINQNTQIGFIAQNINEYFPELVSTNHDGMLSVNYAGMTPILAKAIQELDLKITTIESFASDVNTTFIDSIRNWLGDVGNGITRLFAQQVVTDELCIGSTCVTESQLIDLLNQNGQVVNTPSDNNESSSVDNSGSLDDQSDESEIDTNQENPVVGAGNNDESSTQLPEVIINESPEEVLDRGVTEGLGDDIEPSNEQENLEDSSPSESESNSEESVSDESEPQGIE